jgi:hypothetical protein
MVHLMARWVLMVLMVLKVQLVLELILQMIRVPVLSQAHQWFWLLLAQKSMVQ